MTTTTDYGPDVEVTNADTGEVYPTEVRQEVDRLDSIAEQAPVTGWTPGPANVPAHPERWRKPRQPHHDVPARDYATLTGQARITPDRPAIRDVYAHQEVATDHLHHQAADWKDLAFWAEQQQRLAVSVISDDYQAKRAALEAHYDTTVDALVNGYTPRVEYGGHTYDEQQGFVAAGPPHHTHWPDPAEQERQADDPPPQDPAPPADRTGVENLARRDKERRQREQRAIAPAPEPEPEPGRRGWWRRKWDALLAWDGSGA